VKASRSLGESIRVAILVFPGVEELDFVGFLETLAVANRVVGRKWFETQIIGTKRGPIVCSGGMKVMPDRTIASPGRHEVFFVPGGGASRRGGVSRRTGVDLASKNRRVLELLRMSYRRGEKVWSVCTGALILGSAGLLKGRKAVTHHAFLDQLQVYGARVVNARTVTDGRITTGGGISSSIDVGLELVRKSLGTSVARQVRKGMEYHPPRSR
jgi:transcriptional regulator GlxA family with amidase domain